MRWKSEAMDRWRWSVWQPFCIGTCRAEREMSRQICDNEPLLVVSVEDSVFDF
jgi:hypothetical protein